MKKYVKSAETQSKNAKYTIPVEQTRGAKLAEKFKRQYPKAYEVLGR